MRLRVIPGVRDAAGNKTREKLRLLELTLQQNNRKRDKPLLADSAPQAREVSNMVWQKLTVLYDHQGRRVGLTDLKEKAVHA